MYLVKTPRIIQSLNAPVYWRFPAKEKTLYLTFDDGPHPTITRDVLALLKKYNARATFFCVGKNAREHPQVIKQMQNEGHQPGNHCYRHESGFQTPSYFYYKSFLKARNYVDSRLFRPPYGRIKPKQAQALSKKTHIIMWDILSGDFDQNLDAHKCARRVIQSAQAGSIIVFHDSAKAAPRMLPALEAVLKHFSKQGFIFKAINPNEINQIKKK